MNGDEKKLDSKRKPFLIHKLIINNFFKLLIEIPFMPFAVLIVILVPWRIACFFTPEFKKLKTK